MGRDLLISASNRHPSNVRPGRVLLVPGAPVVPVGQLRDIEETHVIITSSRRRRAGYDLAAFIWGPWQWMWRVLGRAVRSVQRPVLRRPVAGLSV